MTDNELKELVAGLAVSNAELMIMSKETNVKFDRTDAKFAETAAQMAETNILLKEMFKETEAQMKKTDEQMKKTDEQMKRTDEQMKRTDEKLERIGISLGSVTNNIGSITEEYFFNCLFEKPVLGGVKYDKVRRNISGVGLKSEDEFDIVMYNGDSIALIECKNKAHENDLRKLITKKAENFKDVFPNFKDYKIYLGLASFSFYPELEEMAKENGVAILKQKGDFVEIEADNLKVY